MQIFNDIYNKIVEYDTIIIHRHIRPDGDCMGSQLGLREVLRYNFPNKRILACKGAAPDYLEKLGEYDEVKDEDYNGALVIVVDTSDPKRICDDRWQKGEYIIKIDHHDDSPEFGNLMYVDPRSSACSSIITSFIRSQEALNMNEAAARFLFFGIVTDTGRFKYRGVDETLLNNAAYLVSFGVDIEALYNLLYIDDAKVLKLKGHIFNTFKVTPNGVAYMYITEKMMEKFDVGYEDAANLVNNLDSIKGCLIWLAFIEQPNGEIRVRLRSRMIAVNDIAKHYNGGGHLQASGATVYSKKEMKALLAEADEALRVFKEEHPDAY